MFDQTVSRSLPIGVMNPIPVTATRGPLGWDAIPRAYGRGGQPTAAASGKNWRILWTWGPKRGSEELLQVQRELETKPRGGQVQVLAQQLEQLFQAIQDGMAV